MTLLVVGSIGLDTVRTPFGNVTDALGGSATYFSTAASFFTDTALVGVVGRDFPAEHCLFLKSREIDLAGLMTRPGRTFRWSGSYGYQLNEAQTLATHLNVFEEFRPVLPETYRKADAVFLANIDPDLRWRSSTRSRTLARRLRYDELLDRWQARRPETDARARQGSPRQRRRSPPALR